MFRKILHIICYIALAGINLHIEAQSYKITGKISDLQKKEPLTGVSVVLTDIRDSSRRYVTITDNIGNFSIDALKNKNYKIRTTYLGYQKLEKEIEIKNPVENLGELFMVPTNQVLQQVVIVGQVPTSVQKGDTTEMNAAAFVTNPDATAEDLLTKMPTITSTDGKVKAQGESVKHIYIDGKPFFGNDPTLALKNLPADAIDKVQVYDELSDQAKLTGFDDGNTSKTINIITKKDRRNGHFGKVAAGYNQNNKYVVGGNLHFFNEIHKISIIGLSNNINRQNFANQDLLGAMGGGGGITKTNSLGLNYNGTWGKILQLNGSYFYNNSQNQTSQIVNGHYLYSSNPDSNQYFNSQSTTGNRNFNHRLNFKLEYTPDTFNTLIITPQLSFQTNHNNRNSSTANFMGETSPLNSSINTNISDAQAYDFSNSTTFRHKFKKQGRTISIGINNSAHRQDPGNILQAQTYYYDDSTKQQKNINQRSTALNNGYSVSSNLAYTEPLGKISLLELSYNYYYSNNKANKKTYDFDPNTNENDSLNTTLSNIYDNHYITHSLRFGYLLNVLKINALVSFRYQQANLNGARDLPLPKDTVKKTFNNYLPYIMFKYKFSKNSILRLTYNASTNAPSISQLQDVINNSNPLHLSTGNPNLKQEFNQSFSSRYSLSNPDKSTSFFFLLSGSYIQNNISNRTYFADKDTMLGRGILLVKGAKLTQPVNLDHSWNFYSTLNFGFPLHFISSNLNLNTDFNYSSIPGNLNNKINVSNTYTFSQGVVLGSNINPNVDFTLSYHGSYNIVENSLQPKLNNNYYSHSANFRFNLIFWKNLVLENNLSNNLYKGLSNSNFNKNYFLWNLGFGKKLFNKQQGLIMLSVFDLLNQNTNISRTVTETYIRDTQSTILKRYFMLTFTYKLNRYGQHSHHKTSSNS
ncbi:MAG: TonB-dependent receptor [Bacteroidota bacterium]|nr:TonB-dependent receptor [Bacteroidota bacterium]